MLCVLDPSHPAPGMNKCTAMMICPCHENSRPSAVTDDGRKNAARSVHFARGRPKRFDIRHARSNTNTDPMNLDKQSIATVDVAGKRVLMRVDFNVPQDKSGAITNNQVCLCHGELATVGCTSYT